MKKKIIIISIVAAVLTIFTLYFNSRDNIKFKFSYESLNTIEDSNGKKIKVSVPLENRVKYVKSKELLELFKSGTGIVYFGYSSCPWCRNIVPILVDTIIENDIDTLYYVDIHGNGLRQIKDELFEILEPYLRENDEGEKGLAVPDVYAIKKGKIIDHHIGTVPSYKNPYEGMTKKQKKELKEIYTNLIEGIK